MVVLDSEAEVCRVVRRTRLCKHALQSAPRNGPNAKQIPINSDNLPGSCQVPFFGLLNTSVSSSLAEKYDTVLTAESITSAELQHPLVFKVMKPLFVSR